MEKSEEPGLYHKLARIISVIFHPLFMPVYGLLILFTAPTFLKYLPAQVKFLLMAIVLINNVLLPVGMLPLLRYRNVISSYSIEDRTERIIPLLLASILYCTTSFIIFRYQIPFFIKSFIFATSIVAIILSMINFWWKISIHAAAAGALTAMVIMLSFRMHTGLILHLAAVIVVSGMILSSRLKLDAHDPAQVWAGYFTGFLGVSLFILLV